MLLIWAFTFLLPYLQETHHGKRHLLLSGLFFALAAMTQLYAVIPLPGTSVYLLIRWLERIRCGHEAARRAVMAMAVFGLTIIATTLVCMSIYGLATTFQGIVLDNLHRPTQPFLVKGLLFAGFIGLLRVPFLFAYLPIKRHRREPGVQLLLIYAVPLLILYLVQSRTWLHHYTLIVAPVAILGAWGIVEFFSTGKARIALPGGQPDRTAILRQRHPLLKNRLTGRFVQANFVFYKAYDRKGLSSTIAGAIPIARDTVNLDLRPDDDRPTPAPSHK